MSSDSEDDRFQDMLNATLKYNMDPKLREVGKYEMVPEFPVIFYDRHLDSNLSLKRVQVAPMMVRALSDLCDTQTAALCGLGPSCWGVGAPGPHRNTSCSTSWDVASAYQNNLGKFCHPLPSKLLFHPKRRDLMTVFEFTISPTSSHRPTFLTEAYFSVRFPFYNRHNPAYVHQKESRVPASSVVKLKELGTHSPQLAIWEFYPLNTYGEKAIKKMSNISDFVWEIPHTLGRQNIHLPSPHIPDDAGDFIAEILAVKKSRRKVQRMTTPHKVPRHTKTSGEAVSFPWRPTRTDRPYRVNPLHFLQHAWARAVANDATFIVFNCGNYERIGFRHRASQTLYLSELIDTMNCQDPAYGKLHVGLYFAIVQDAMNRQQLRLTPSLVRSSMGTKTAPVPTKRAAESVLPYEKKASKRRKIGIQHKEGPTEASTHNSSLQTTIASALSKRNLALISLDYGVHRSTVPSSFIRRKPSCVQEFHQRNVDNVDQKAKYSPHQYFSLTLSKPIDAGATGTVHRASAEVQMESGAVLQHPLIVKLVFLDRETRPGDLIPSREETEEDRIYNEYSIYQHLASAGIVEGLLPVYGLFEDVDSGTLAFIMEDGGTSLKRRQLQATGTSAVITVISETERDVLLRTMKKIHEAGIRHRDIRTENIVVNSKDGAFIIDFDRAEHLSYPSESLDCELRCMQDIVNGNTLKGGYYSF